MWILFKIHVESFRLQQSTYLTQMRKIINIMLAILMSVMATFPISAKLGISVYTGRSIVFDAYAKNEMDYALYAANGRDWFVENVLFSDYGSVFIFFAPGNFIGMKFKYYRQSSKQEPTEEYIIGIKKALDYLAERDGILYIRDSCSLGVNYGVGLKDLLEAIHMHDHWFFFLFPEWRAEARFGRLGADNSKGMVSMVYNNGATIDAFGESSQEGSFISAYEESCRKKGVRPILRPHQPYGGRPECYSDADIDFFLECRFGDLDFNKTEYHTEQYPTQELVHVLDYEPAISNERTFQLYKTTTLTPRDTSDPLDDYILTMAVYPSELGPVGRLRSLSKISRALYEANGREWFVENMLFSPRMRSDLYFPENRLFCYRTEYTPDDGFVSGLARAIDLLSVKKDTLCAPVRGCKAPYDVITDKAVEDWIEKNRQHYLFDDSWTAEVRAFGWEFLFKDIEKRNFEPFALEDISIWPHLDNGTEEGRIFRSEYEKDCKARNLKIIGDHDIEPRSDYSDEDIDLFVDWIMKANDYYISLPPPSVLRAINVSYSVGQVNERKLTTREVCRQ